MLSPIPSFDVAGLANTRSALSEGHYIRHVRDTLRWVETGGPGAFSELNDEELQQAILEQMRELAEIDPDFAKQLAQQKRATKH